MKRTGIDKICTYLEEKKLSVEDVIRIAFYAGNLEGNKEIIVADEEAEMSLVADVSEDVIRASHNQHNLFDWWDVVEKSIFRHASIVRDTRTEIAERERCAQSSELDELHAGSSLKVEHWVYCGGDTNTPACMGLTLEELKTLRRRSAAAEDRVFKRIKALAYCWESQARETMYYDMAIENGVVIDIKNQSLPSNAQAPEPSHTGQEV